MSVWVRNLKTRLEDRPVVILHGNVRDKYIDEGLIYNNLTEATRPGQRTTDPDTGELDAAIE